MKIALVEISNSHNDCLYSQIRFLKSKPSVNLTLIYSKSLMDKINYFNDVDSTHAVNDNISIYEVLKLRNYLIKEKFNKVIFNTCQGTIIRNLLFFPYPKSMEFLGILHDTRKLDRSRGQKIISKKVRKYFVLNDYLLKSVVKKSGIKVSSIYTIFFPKYKKINMKKEINELWVTIPGQVELKRRDYESLLRAFEKNRIKKNIKFILLGRSTHPSGDGEYIKRRIKELGVSDNFVLWENFIDNDTYFSYLDNSDYIMPLIHRAHVSYSLYDKQISGGFNLAFGYKIPLLMEESFKEYEDFKNNAIFYNRDNMIEIINGLNKKNEMQYYKEEKWSFEYQAKKYWGMIDA